MGSELMYGVLVSQHEVGPFGSGHEVEVITGFKTIEELDLYIENNNQKQDTLISNDVDDELDTHLVYSKIKIRNINNE